MIIMKEQARQIKNLSELEAAKNEEEQRLLGIEKDFAEDEENDDLKIPYDADKIRVDSNVFSVFQIKRLIDRGMLDLMPAFQRKEGPHSLGQRKRGMVFLYSRCSRSTH